MTDQIAERAPSETAAKAVDPAATPSAAQPRMRPVTLVMAVAATVVLALFVGRRWYRLPADPPRPEVMSPGMSFILFMAFQLLAFGSAPLVVMLWGVEIADGAEAARRLTVEDNAKLAVGRAVAQAVAVVLFLRLCRAPATFGAPRIARRSGHLRATAIGVGAMVMMWPVIHTFASASASLSALLRGVAPDPVAHDTLKLMVAADVGPWFVVLAICVVVVAPVVEEIMYRGLIQDMLRRLGLPAWPAIVATSVIFAGMHWSNARPHALATLLVLSLGFGWAFARTGRLAAPIAMHVLFNVANLALAMWGRP